MLLIVAILLSCLLIFHVMQMWSQPPQSATTNSQNNLNLSKVNDLDCGTVDYSRYLRDPKGRTENDIAAFRCIDNALVNCSPAHINLFEDAISSNTTDTVKYSVVGYDSLNTCDVAVTSLVEHAPGEICKFTSSYFAKVFSPRITPGMAAFSALYISIKTRRIAEANGTEQPLECTRL